MNDREMLIEGAGLYNIELSDEKINKFISYMDLVKEWNEKINLTAITENADFINKHFVDSISIFKSGVFKPGKKMIDVGTGAGFPGIPIKIIEPDIHVMLLDSLNKRINFLNTVIESLDLKGIKTEHGRAEEFAHKDNFREKYDIATARAVAGLNVLCELCMPYVKVGGYFIAMKGPSVYEEIENSRNAVGTLGGKIVDIIETKNLQEETHHKLIIVEKIKHTEGKFPRKYAQIEKKPIM
jgi:16S rRNA (guanine527-N7)-methyltransferase